MNTSTVAHVAIYAAVVAAGLYFFTRTLMTRLGVLRAATSFDARGDVAERLKAVLVDVFGQGRLLHGDFKAGLMHFFIFWGFVILLFNTLHFLLHGFTPQASLELPLLGREQPLGGVYLLLRDSFNVLVLLAVSYAAWRRLVVKPKRLTLSREGLLILGLIGTLMLTDMLMNACALGYLERTPHPLSFIESGLGPVFAAWPQPALAAIYHSSWWLHLGTLLLFLNLLPLSKHFHVLLSPFNVYLRNLSPMGRLPKIDFENTEEFGVSKLTQFTWKNWFDSYNCTECGRCDSFCPANQTGKVLSPQHIIIGTREELYRLTPRIIVQLAKANAEAIEKRKAGEAPAPLSPSELGDALLEGDFPLLVGGIHTDEALWACTTCGACDTHCPVHIEHVRPIVEMRRHLVMEQEGRFPKELQTLFRGLETQGNPWGLGAHTRMDWAEGLEVPTLETNPDAEYLYFVGCFGSLDSRSKPATVALVKLLLRAGVNFAVIGKREACNGDPARRCGHEFLAQQLMEQTAEIMREMKPRKVITACPHCYNAFRNELGDFDVKLDEVIHHSELLAKLVADGRIKVSEAQAAGQPVPRRRRIVFHDSCYLGRYNSIYEQPRETLRAAGMELLESKSCKDKGYCCGAGGGQMFMEEKVGRRVNSFRYEQLEETGADEVAVACPFCMTMIDDAAKSGERRQIPVRDIALVLEEATRGAD